MSASKRSSMTQPARRCQWQLELLLLMHDHRHCVRASKEMDSKSIGLCPQGFESPRCRFARTALAQSSMHWPAPARCHLQL